MVVNQLPRLILAVMFLSLAGIGYSAKMSQTIVTFTAEAFFGTTFDLS